MVHGKLVLVRHGQSLSNKSHKYTGWDDPGLSALGLEQAAEAGRLIKREGIRFDVAFCSRLRRTNQTMGAVLAAMGQADLTAHQRWRLNERHVGILQGLTKDAVVERYGELQVRAWRFGLNQAPPPMPTADPRHPSSDPLYADVDQTMLPSTESLADTRDRVRSCWNADILPLLQGGANVLVAGHGVALWALANLALAEAGLELPVIKMPNADPLLLSFSERMQLLTASYLGGGAELPKNLKNIQDSTKDQTAPLRLR